MSTSPGSLQAVELYFERLLCEAGDSSNSLGLTLIAQNDMTTSADQSSCSTGKHAVNIPSLWERERDPPHLLHNFCGTHLASGTSFPARTKRGARSRETQSAVILGKPNFHQKPSKWNRLEKTCRELSPKGGVSLKINDTADFFEIHCFGILPNMNINAALKTDTAETIWMGNSICQHLSDDRLFRVKIDYCIASYVGLPLRLIWRFLQV